MPNNFKPIIKKKNKSSLNSKEVDIEGQKDFGRGYNEHINNIIKSANNNKSIEKDPFFSATLTQKISPSVNLKINTLKPFLDNIENMYRPTINEVINLVIDNYLETKLSSRQKEIFTILYENQAKANK